MDSSNRWAVGLLAACGLGLLGLVVAPYLQQERPESLPSPSPDQAIHTTVHAQPAPKAAPKPTPAPAPTPVPPPERIEPQAAATSAPAPPAAGTVAAPSEPPSAPAVAWTRTKCMEVDQALRIDSTRAIRRQFENIRKGHVRAADSRRIDAMRACADGAMKAATAADFGDDDEATRVMLEVYRVWNEVRASLGLQVVAYGSIPEDARLKIDADRAELQARRESALDWTDQACKQVDAALEADAQRLPPTSRARLRAFIKTWQLPAGGFSDRLLSRDASMRKLYEHWNAHRRDSLDLPAVAYGSLPGGAVVARTRPSEK